MGNLQIKNVPDELHERLRQRAAAEHLTVRDYVLRLIERDVARPSWAEWLETRSTRPAIDVPPGLVVELIRAGREQRTDEILRAVQAAESDPDAPYRP